MTQLYAPIVAEREKLEILGGKFRPVESNELMLGLVGKIEQYISQTRPKAHLETSNKGFIDGEPWISQIQFNTSDNTIDGALQITRSLAGRTCIQAKVNFNSDSEEDFEEYRGLHQIVKDFERDPEARSACGLVVAEIGGLSGLIGYGACALDGIQGHAYAIAGGFLSLMWAGLLTVILPDIHGLYHRWRQNRQRKPAQLPQNSRPYTGTGIPPAAITAPDQAEVPVPAIRKGKRTKRNARTSEGIVITPGGSRVKLSEGLDSEAE